MYCIVLYWRGGHYCPMHCDLSKIYCAPPNLGITRTWICRLNFAQKPIFEAWGFLTSLKSQTREPRIKVPPGGLVLGIFTSWKNPSTSAGFEPGNLDSRGEHDAPRPPRLHVGARAQLEVTPDVCRTRQRGDIASQEGNKDGMYLRCKTGHIITGCFCASSFSCCIMTRGPIITRLLPPADQYFVTQWS